MGTPSAPTNPPANPAPVPAAAPVKESTPSPAAPAPPARTAPPAPSLGRIVLFAFLEGAKVVERPAIVVDVAGSAVDLQVFANGDSALRQGGETPCVVQRAGVAAADDPGVAQADRWRWPPRAAAAAT